MQTGTTVKCTMLMIAVLSMVMGSAQAMEVTDLPFTQRVDWTLAGHSGDIPEIDAPVVDVTRHGAKGDGTTDDSAAIQDAIDTAGARGIVFLPAGDYRIEAPLRLKSGVVLRGEGYRATRLSCRSADGCISVTGKTDGAFVTVQSDATKGSDRIVVADASGFTAGRGGQIQQDDIVTASADWGENAVGQMVRITAVDGNTLTIAPPLHLAFPVANNARIRPIDYCDQVGIEDLAIVRRDSGDGQGSNLNFRYAADCWIRRVESNWTEKYHIAVSESVFLEIREAYIHDAESRGGGGYGYGVSLARHVTSVLVENNIFDDLRHAMIVQLGTNGCVFGYNYARRNYSDDDGGWAKTYISLHGHYASMNLFEGNVVAYAGVGDYWGPVGPGNTLFRNRILGTDRFDSIGDHHGLLVGYIHGAQNIIGNDIRGGTIYTSAATPHPDVDYAEEWQKVVYHGNSAEGTVLWNPMFTDPALPASFYLTTRPGFLNASAWPPMGGDLSQSQATIPAQQRFDSGEVIPGISDPSSQTSGTGGSSGGGGCFIGQSRKN